MPISWIVVTSNKMQQLKI